MTVFERDSCCCLMGWSMEWLSFSTDLDAILRLRLLVCPTATRNSTLEAATRPRDDENQGEVLRSDVWQIYR